LVGICYKEKGSEEAVKLGHQLVAGEIKETRVEAWRRHLEKYPGSLFYCFRGGLRSQIAQQWVAEVTGQEIPRLEGGYKAFRNYLIEKLEPERQTSQPILLGGYTGSGKTVLLKRLQNAIDLEGLANYRGSAFGKRITPQPAQIDFENNLAYALIQHRNKAYSHLIIEDEGKNVGRCYLPKPLAAFFNSGDCVILKTPLSERVQNIVEEYVFQSQKNYMEEYESEQGLAEWARYIRDSVCKIQKRLGADRCQKILTVFEEAYQQQIEFGNCDSHNNWVEMLLTEYYNPMYRYQIEKKTSRIIFEGNFNEVLSFLQNNKA